MIPCDHQSCKSYDYHAFSIFVDPRQLANLILHVLLEGLFLEPAGLVKPERANNDCRYRSFANDLYLQSVCHLAECRLSLGP